MFIERKDVKPIKKAKPKINGEAQGVTLGFNTSEKPQSKKEEILFRKFK